MPAPLVGGVLWGIGAILGAFASKIFDFFFKFVAVKTAWRMTIGTAFVLAASAVTVATAVIIKGIVLAAQIAMPQSLGASTYFLPNNINIILGIYVSVRLAVFVWQWTLRNMERFMTAGI